MNKGPGYPIAYNASRTVHPVFVASLGGTTKTPMPVHMEDREEFVKKTAGVREAVSITQSFHTRS